LLIAGLLQGYDAAVWNSLPKTVVHSDSVTVFKPIGERHSSSPGLSLFPLLSSTLPGPSASEVTLELMVWRYTNMFIIIAEWLACWTQAQKGRVQIAVAMLSGNSLRQTIHTHCASVHQAAKLVAALLRVAGVTAGLAESNGSLPPGL